MEFLRENENYKIYENSEKEIVCEIINQNVKELYLDNLKITKINGLEQCKNLEKLSCINNKLKTLNVSQNAKLEFLNCKNNYLENLDISDCSKLQYLNLYNNNIETLDISNNKLLITVCVDITKTNIYKTEQDKKLKMIVDENNNIIWKNFLKNKERGFMYINEIDLNREYERIDELYEKQKNKINENSQWYINKVEKLENELENYDPFYKNVSKEFLDFWNNNLCIKHDLQDKFDDDYKANNLKESIDFLCDLSDDYYDKFIDFYTKDEELKTEFKQWRFEVYSQTENEKIDFSKPDFEFVEMFINDKAGVEYYSTFEKRCEVKNLLEEKQIYENVNKYEFFINTFIDMVNECDFSNSLSFKLENVEYIQPNFYKNVVNFTKTGTWGYRSLTPNWEKELYIQPEIKILDKKINDVVEDEIYASKHNQYQNLKVSKNLTFDDNLCFGLLKDLQNQTEDFLKEYERHQTKQQDKGLEM